MAVRICDLANLVASSRGKIEMTLAEDEASEDKLIRSLTGEAVKALFSAVADPEQFEQISEQFEGNLTFPAGDELSAREFIENMKAVDGLVEGARRVASALNVDAKDEQMLAAAGEFLLEGLYVNNRLSKFDSEGKAFFKR